MEVKRISQGTNTISTIRYVVVLDHKIETVKMYLGHEQQSHNQYTCTTNILTQKKAMPLASLFQFSYDE